MNLRHVTASIFLTLLAACSVTENNDNDNDLGVGCSELADKCKKCSNATVKQACETDVKSGDCQDGLDDPDILQDCVDRGPSGGSGGGGTGGAGGGTGGGGTGGAGGGAAQGACQEAAALCPNCREAGLRAACEDLVRTNFETSCASWLQSPQVASGCR